MLKTSEKFDSVIELNDNMILTSKAFYRYMLFLINVHNGSKNVDNRTLNAEMIRIQKLWHETYFKKQFNVLHEMSHEIEIPTEEINRFNDLCLLNPIIFAQHCIPCTERDVLEIMKLASENVLIFFADHIIAAPIFPFENNSINYHKHNIDNCLLDYVNKIKKNKWYKLSNILDSDKYMLSIHKRFKINTQLMMYLFDKERELYELITAETDIDLLPYSQEISLGMVTQLFPILEIKIRELVTLLGRFPYKMNKDEFMQNNDPSSLLREIIEDIYNEQGSFENIADFMYIYNIMYNSNSFNIRNECIHGRDYMHSDNLKFAFKATLFAIYMVVFRIKTIQDNISDLI